MKENYQKIGLWLGPIIALSISLLPIPLDMSQAAWYTAAGSIWMAIWWCTEAVPVAVTALIPLVVFPLFGIGNIKVIATPYSSPIIYLFWGGFVLALAIEKWNLHKRIALMILTSAGHSGRSLIGGFMFASAIISMSVSYTHLTLTTSDLV